MSFYFKQGKGPNIICREKTYVLGEIFESENESAFTQVVLM